MALLKFSLFPFSRTVAGALRAHPVQAGLQGQAPRHEAHRPAAAGSNPFKGMIADPVSFTHLVA